LADPLKSGYQVKWPIHGNKINTHDYESIHAALNDIEMMWETIIEQELRINHRDFKVSSSKYRIRYSIIQ